MNEQTEESKRLKELEETPEHDQEPKPDKALKEAVARVEKLLAEIRENQEILNRNQARIYKWVTEH